MRVGFFVTCLVDLVRPAVGFAAIKLLKSAPQTSLPLVLELKEKTGPEAPSAADQLAAARKAMARFEKEWASAK